jgi:regulatory protein
MAEGLVQIPARSWQESGMRPQKPIDAAGLQALALHYAARFATTSTKLRHYLQRKLRERPWAGEGTPDIDGLVERLTALGYVDDAGWAVMKRRAMAARGLGPRRVAQALNAAGVADVESDEHENPIVAAVRFAQRRRLGPFRREGAATDEAAERRALAAMLRAGHSFDVTRRVLAARDGAAADALAEDDS